MREFLRRIWVCPFYKDNYPCGVNCEGGKIRLPDISAGKQYITEYCTHESGWRRCTIARACLRHYEQEEERTKGAPQRAKSPV